MPIRTDLPPRPLVCALATAAVLFAAAPARADDKAANTAPAEPRERRSIVIKIDGKELDLPDVAGSAIDKAMAAVHGALASADRSSVNADEVRETILKAIEEAGSKGAAIFRSAANDRQKGNPYAAREVREFRQTLGDGTVIQRSSTRLLARDSEGRTRQELRQADGSARVFINDPVAKEAYIVDPQKQTACRAGFDERAIHDCFRQMKGDWKPLGFGFIASNRSGIAMMSTRDDVNVTISPRAQILDFTQGITVNRERGAGSAAPLPPTPPVPPALANAGTSGVTTQLTREKKTGQPYEGLSVDTERSVEIVAAGAIGNSKAIETVVEKYYSPELKMTVYHRRIDPRNGESLYRMTDIKRGDPDASLFRPPASYAMSEGKR
ncbi:MAG: hypothetical protein JNL19_07030 [Burkholderiales bacterium]|nr:hypothetical protein [Burkholderiales bacterium]